MTLKITNILVLLGIISIIPTRVLVSQEIDPPEIDPPEITLVTVVDTALYTGAVKIYWKGSTTPEVAYYIIHHNRSNTTEYEWFKVDSIPASNPLNQYSYFAATEEADLHSEIYRITAYDVDGNFKYSDTAATIFLNDIVFDTCKNVAQLTWNSYNGWDEGAKYQVKKNGTSLLTTYRSDTTYIDKNVVLDSNVEYYIVAQRNNQTSFKSESNRGTVVFPSYIKPAADQFFIQQVTNKGTEVDLLIHTDTAAQVMGYVLQKCTEKDGNYISVDTSFNVTTPNLTFSFNYTDTFYYKIIALDPCKRISGETQRVQPLKLEVEKMDYQVNLNWNQPTFIDSNDETYEIFVSVDGNDLEPKVSKTLFSLNELGDETSEEFCFYVIATDPEGHTSISNTVCVTRTPKLDIPNAFSPNGDGTNDTFGPFSKYIKNVTISTFKLLIYDRYGGVVFQTKNAGDTWDGNSKGKPVSEGAYLYYLEYTTSTGQSQQVSGAIHVVYP